jgi:hypothetical protein
METIDSLLDPSKKFMGQLNKIFNNETVDLIHVSERIEAAFGYFFKPMDDLVFEILWKLEEVKRLKKSKAYYDELIVLEELQTKAVLRLMKAKLLIETVVAGESISKEKLTSEEIAFYILSGIAYQDYLGIIAGIDKKNKTNQGDQNETTKKTTLLFPKNT